MKTKLFTLGLLLVSINANTFAQINWQSTNGPEGGAFRSVYDDGQYAFAADKYHFFRTGDGLSWEQLTFWKYLAPSDLSHQTGRGKRIRV